MNSSQGPIDRPEDEPRGPGADRPPTDSGDAFPLPQTPFPDGNQDNRRAIGGSPPAGSAGGAALVAAEGLATVLWAVASFVILYWTAQTFDFNAWILVMIWLLSGFIVFWPGSDGLIAKYLLGLRRPTMLESQRLGPSWYAVANRARIDLNDYTVWIQEAETPTSSTTGGNTVSVTRWALYTLPPTHLEAALAHGLAGHLRGRTWLGRLLHWYSAPARIVGLVLRLLLKLSRAIPAVGCTIIGFLIVAYLGIILAALVFYDSLAVPLMFLLPLFSPLLFMGAGKLLERMADRATVDQGYARQLLEVFYGWQAQHQDGARRTGFAQPDWLAGQPSIAERIRALEVYAQRR